MLSRYARHECFAICAMAVILAISCVLFGVAWLMVLPLAAGTAALLFYRDPKRTPPKDRNVAVSPADGQISSIHEVAYFDPFGGPAVCVRIFLSIFDVHVNYCPAHAVVHAISHKPGDHVSVLNPRSAEVNESITVVFNHPTHKMPILAVRQIAGLLARTVFCALHEGQIVQRGSKLGIMKLGSTAELYLPVALDQVLVRQGQRVVGAITPLAILPPKPAAEQTCVSLAQDAPLAPKIEEHAAHSVYTSEIAEEAARYGTDSFASVIHPKPDEEQSDADGGAGHSESLDLTEHAINHVMASDDIHSAANNVTAGHDGEYLAARMENAGTDLMLHPVVSREDSRNLAESLSGLRPDADTSDDEALLRNSLPLERQPGLETPEDSGDWQVFPPSKKNKKPKSDGLLWEEAP